MSMLQTLYIDLDGVVADFDQFAREKIADFDILEVKDRDDAVDLMILSNRNIFDLLEPMPGAIESVTRLFNLYEVYFLSTPMWSVPESFTAKRLWIEHHFGALATKRLILSHRKDLNIGEYLVDDRLHNGAGKFTGKHIHFGQSEFPNWEVTEKYLTQQFTNHILSAS